jgi:hypothetical protein
MLLQRIDNQSLITKKINTIQHKAMIVNKLRNESKKKLER